MTTRSEAPPLRVQVALEYITLMANKAASRIAANDLKIEEIPGQKLTKAELNTQTTAAHILNEYFLGKLPLDRFEKRDAKKKIPAITIEMDDEEDEPEERDGGTTMPCFECVVAHGAVNPQCERCKGKGNLIFFPFEEDE